MSSKRLVLFQKLLWLCQPLITKTLLHNEAKIQSYIQNTQTLATSGMVTEFNFLHDLFYKSFFRRVQTLNTDIKVVRDLHQKGPIVYVIKNRGQLEYRYFNELFLKERLKLVSSSNTAFTLFWWPFKKIWQYLLAQLHLFYQHKLPKTDGQNLPLLLKNQQHVFLNLSVSRNDLFGLIQNDPLEPLRPLIDAQRESETAITLVPLHFLYDKDPLKSEKTFFDLLFGEKSRPGAFRKFLLMLVSYRKTPQAKFGEPLDLKAFLAAHASPSAEDQVQALNSKIEDVLRIEHAKITGPTLKAKSQIIKTILADEQFLAQLKILADNSNSSIKDLKQNAEKMLNEIAADVNYSYIQFFYIALDYLWNHVYDGVMVKHEQLAKIRAQAGKNPIVLVPMHRSHIDYLLISYIFYANNITFPHTCAGINMNFWPVGKLFRKSGAFYIRRSTQGDQLYKETLNAYLKSLLSQDYCIEFFIEGTRSRTGKMLKPKLGILKMLLKAFDEGACEDIHFVPISINYDHIFEEKAYMSERSGQDKQKETAGALLKTGKFLGRKYGKVYIEFGEPISFQNYQTQVKQSDGLETLSEVTEAFGYHLTREMNRIALVTPISLVALAMFSIQKTSFTYAELYQQIQKCKAYLNYKNVSYSDLILYNEDWAYQQTLQTLIARHLIREVKTYEGVFYHVETQRRIQLDYYKNNILHFFVSLGCLSKIFLSFQGTTFSSADLAREYKQLKELFSEEFTFSSSSTLDEHVQKIVQYGTTAGWIKVLSNDQMQIFDTPTVISEITAFAGLINNFLETHLLTLMFIKFNTIQKFESKHLVRDILEKSKPLYLRPEFKHPESLGQFYVEASLKLWVKMGVLEDQVEGKKTLFSYNKDKAIVQAWIDQVQRLLQSSQSTIAIQEGINESVIH